jgi:hypothetical protein
MASLAYLKTHTVHTLLCHVWITGNLHHQKVLIGFHFFKIVY